MSWIGRISATKGLDEAVQTALVVNKKLVIHGKVNDIEQEYFDAKVKPFLDNPDIDFRGETTGSGQKSDFLGNARLMLFPLHWEEPFGIVLIESMACGTPVVAYAKGAIPEVVKDGVTGFIVNPSDEDIRGDYIVRKTGQEGLKEAIERIYAMSNEEYAQMRANCRKHVEENFTIEKMVEGYEKVYTQIIEDSKVRG